MLTTEANAEVGRVYPKAMPVIPDDRGGARCLDARTVGRGRQAVAAITGRRAQARCHRREGRCGSSGLKKQEWTVACSVLPDRKPG
jgi:hypothetical protein